MADVGRIPRRKKGARFHPKEAPFPIPIQSISGKQSSTDRWYYYTGHFRDNCVVIEDSGDLTFLYKMGFFGKGFLSRSKPEYETISNISQKAFSKSEKLRRLPPKEREIRQSKFRIVRKERFKNHKQWWQKATGKTCEQDEKTCESLGDKIVNKKGIISPSPKKRKRMHVETAKLKDVTSVNQLEFCNGTIETETQSNDNDNDDDGDDDDDDNNKEEEDDDDLDYNDDDDDDDRNVLSNSNGDGEASITNRDLDEVMQDVVRNKRGSSSASRLESNQKKSDRAIAKAKGTNHKACSTRQDDPYKVYEHLQLSLEEAFFLSYGLGCLSVLDKDKKPLSLGQMWCAFCEAKQEFIPNYVSYHYFRSKGWVPKMGIKYGTDLVLYKEGMPFYHSSYSVIVQTVDHQREDTEKSAKTISVRELSWRQLCGVGRVNEHAAKELMICYVIKPSDMKNEELSSPKCISRFKIQEVVLRRWIPERAREPDKEKS